MDEDAAATAAGGGSEGSTSSTSSTCRLASSKAIAVSSTQSTMSVLTQVEAALHPSLKAAEIKVTEAMQQFVQDIESRISASLKQAAGDVIAHLGKEAAARVLAAERKVAFLEQELMNSKEQALSMLLRIKHATDTQTFDLEKQLSAQRTRAEEAEAKVTTLQDLVKRLKAQCKKRGDTLGRTQRLSNPADTLQEEVPENRGRVPTDSLSLIAGVACDVIGQQPESTFFYHVGPSGTECSSPSEGKDRSKKPREEASNGVVELESSCAQNASIMDTHNSDAMAVDMSGRNITAHSDEQQLKVGSASVDVRDMTSLEMTSRQQSAHDALSSDTGDDVSNEASGVSSLAAADLGPEHFPIENPGGQRGKRKNRRVSSSEKLSRLMIGCKRARGMKASTKVSTGEHTDTKRSINVVVESCRDSRRLMQGARQLFSLAERKW